MNDFNEIQKDHMLVMKAVVSSLQMDKPLVLKGGTALLLAYGLDRFSEDLDFDVTNDFSGKTTLNLLSSLKNITSNKFKITNVNLKKDTNTVTRYNLSYQTENSQRALKIEISYRNAYNNVNEINGFKVADLKDIASFKAASVLDELRTKARDLYDLNYILNSNPDVIQTDTLLRLNKLSLDDLYSRYQESFNVDLIIQNVPKDALTVVIELKNALETEIKNRLDANVEAMRRIIDTRFAGQPDVLKEKHAALDARLPDIASGKIELQPPTVKQEPNIEVQTKDQGNMDRGR